MADSVTYSHIVEAHETISGEVQTTPLLRIPDLETSLGAALALKAELLQVTGSFKARGALNWVRRAPEGILQRGLITVSAGNHAKALAWAARAADAPLTVVMPAAASPVKAEDCRVLGARVVLHGTINETWAHAEKLREEQGLTMVPPYDDPGIIAGQGTAGLEIVQQHPEVDTVVCPVGGGGLVSGVAIAVKQLRPDARVIGVEPAGAPTLGEAWRRGGPVTLESTDTLAASLGANRAGEHTWALSRRWVDDLITVTEEEIRTGFRLVAGQGKLLAEPGAAVAVAAMLAGKIDPPGHAVVGLVTGGNLDLDRVSAIAT